MYPIMHAQDVLSPCACCELKPMYFYETSTGVLVHRFITRNEYGVVQDVEVAADTDYTKLAGLLEGFSGDDCTSVCRDAAMNGLRRKIAGKTPEEIRCALLRFRTQTRSLGMLRMRCKCHRLLKASYFASCF